MREATTPVILSSAAPPAAAAHGGGKTVFLRGDMVEVQGGEGDDKEHKRETPHTEAGVVPSTAAATAAVYKAARRKRVSADFSTAGAVSELYTGRNRRTRKFARRHRRLGTCCVLSTITLVLVPLCAFGFTALLAVPLWSIECAETQADGSVVGVGEDDVCSYYEWFKYILGNLVGLGNPLTNVSPSSEHIVSEVIDLVVSTWALAMVGTSVGIISGLASVTSFALEVESFLKALFLCEPCAYGDGLDGAEFIAKLREEGFSVREVSDQQAKAIFKNVCGDDGEESHTHIDWLRAQEIFRSLREVVDKRLIWRALDRHADAPIVSTRC